MARTRKSHDTDEENTKSRRGPPVYPYVVYASWQPQSDNPESMRWLVLKFKDAHGARNMIHALTRNLWGGKYELKHAPSLNWHYMQFENGMRVSLRDNEQYTKVMELEFNEENAYVSPEVQQFKYGSVSRPHGTDLHPATDTKPEASDDGRRKNRTKRDKGSSRDDVGQRAPKADRKPKLDRTGLVSANDIAKELGVEGREVRGVLRALKWNKPQGGWAWKPEEAEGIKAQIKAGLKKKKT